MPVAGPPLTASGVDLIELAGRNMLIVGTAGWTIPKQYSDECPLSGSHLERYSKALSGVEINTSFKQKHQRRTYERWAASTPAEFRFSVKLPKQISHEARLVSCERLLDEFAETVSGLGNKLDALLLQLPPTAEYDASIAEGFFDSLASRISANVFIEPRNRGWFTSEADALMKCRRVSRVAADPAIIPEAAVPGGWIGRSYYRLHGSPRTYYSNYDETFLAELRQQLEFARSTWCIFDNTAAGAALGNALTFAKMPRA